MDYSGDAAWAVEYASVSEFKHHLDEEATFAHKEFKWEWVFWRENGRQQQQQRFVTLLGIPPVQDWNHCPHLLLQFWAVVKVEGRHHHLSTSDQPFSVSKLNRGACCYRRQFRDHVYVVDMELGADDDEQQQIGGVGRVYRNKYPESSPDLRLYSITEFPTQPEASLCGFKYYLALPLFDVHTNQCYGVLELLWHDRYFRKRILGTLDHRLQVAGLRSTHSPLNVAHFKGKNHCMSEITELLELATAIVPRLYLALVSVPCKQCANTNTSPDLRCMEIPSVIDFKDIMFNSRTIDVGAYEYLEAGLFHYLQVDDCSFRSNLCDVRISRNSLAHYVNQDRMSHSFAIPLQSVHSNDLYVVEFFLLQPKSTQDPYSIDDSLHQLLRIMEMNLKSFKPGYSRQTSVVEFEIIDSIEVMKSCKQNVSELNFTAFLETLDSCCLRPSSDYNNGGERWVFCRQGGERLCENGNNSLHVPTPVEQKVEDFMKKIAIEDMPWHRGIVQFWVPKMEGGRCYLETSDQPYAVSCLTKGVASFRKKCLQHYYFVDDETKEEELGPPGRVFRKRHPELTPDLLLYTEKEFQIRNYAVHCFSEEYLVLPIFDDERNHMCVGVLEFLGFPYFALEDIGRALEATKLCSTHIDLNRRFLAEGRALRRNLDQTMSWRKKALDQLSHALAEIYKSIPQNYMANVWVPYGDTAASTNSNSSCMELALSNIDFPTFQPTDHLWIHVQTKKGMVGMALASENKSCFCRNIYEFSIADQPLSHYEIRERRDVCFAICLQSMYTGEQLYVLELFLKQGPATYEYFRSLLNSLLSIMKQRLPSFSMACGKELGEELVVEVIEFSDADTLCSSGSEAADVFPIKFKSVKYSQKEHQHSEEQQKEECTVAASCSKTRERGKRKTGLNLSLEVLKSHFGKKLDDVAEELGVGKSTIKRACRGYGIDRWPCNKKDASLLTKEFADASQQDMLPSTSNIQPLDASLHLNAPDTTTEEKVTVKVKYEEDIIKFELYLSLGFGKLKEAVAERLNLEMGTFKLKYKDEDGDEILLNNDDDLQLCRKNQITMGRSYIELLISSSSFADSFSIRTSPTYFY